MTARARRTEIEPVSVTLASSRDITVDVCDLVLFRCLGREAFVRAATIFVDAVRGEDSILVAGRITRQAGPAARGPVHSEGPNRANGGAL